jgi:multiple sugar transport system ATP-binding protein
VAEISFANVSKTFPDGTEALSGFTLEVSDGELMVFVGPSGCGKTTALRLVAGLEKLSTGTIRIGERAVTNLPPQRRDVAMVFQNYALYPHMTVKENMAFALSLRRRPRGEIDQKVSAAARLLGIDPMLRRKPRELSGGQRQRVAMGRAIVREPQAFLMDEPLSNLDAKLRVQMRTEIATLQRELRVTTIYVTHDQVEAMTLGDRVAVIRRGKLQQVDDPESIYERPANLFVAGFIGSPAMNFVEADLIQDDGAVSARFADHRLPIDSAALERHPAAKGYVGRRVVLGLRPELFEEASLARGLPSEQRLSAVCSLREALGPEMLVHFDVDAAPVLTEDIRELALDVGPDAVEELEQRASTSKTTFVARVSPQARVREGERVELAVDTARLQFFDPASGLAVH